MFRRLGFKSVANLDYSGRNLFVNGYRYQKNCVNGEIIRWKCATYVRTKCRSRISTQTINGSEMMKITNPHHNHGFEFEPKQYQKL